MDLPADNHIPQWIELVKAGNIDAAVSFLTRLTPCRKLPDAFVRKMFV